ncbi:MAG: glycosyltransferase family 1 protein [Patescibacteria group bacterium]|jgi:glycosyltransferase involved in cell wall biosynthesis
MNIGVDIRVLTDKEYSGVSWYTLDLLSAILAVDKEKQYFLYYNSFKDQSSRLPKFNQSNVKIYSTRFPNKIFYLLQKFLRWPKLDLTAIKPHLKIDVFWSPHINFSSFSKNCKKILTVYDLSFLLYPEFFSWRKNFWHRFLNFKKLIKNSDKIIAISENTKQDLIKISNISADKIVVVYPGVGKEFQPLPTGDLQKIKEKYNLPDKFILNIGSIEPRKNIAGLVRAFDVVADKLNDYYLVLAGGAGWKNKEIFSAITNAKNKDRIKILGYVDYKDRPALYNLATIFAYPSFYEGFGLPILEAMACGTPVITSDSSSLPEVAGDAAVLVDSNNEKALELAIIALTENEELRNSLIAKGLERVKLFTWKKSAKEYLRIFYE